MSNVHYLVIYVQLSTCLKGEDYVFTFSTESRLSYSILLSIELFSMPKNVCSGK